MLKVWLFLLDLLQWARTTFPQVFSVGVIVYDSMAKRIRDLETENQKLRLQIKERENQDALEAENKGKTDLDVVDSILNDPANGGGAGTKS